MLDQLLARAVQLGSLPRLARIRAQPHAVQARLLRGLLARAQRTEWGRRYGYGNYDYNRYGNYYPNSGGWVTVNPGTGTGTPQVEGRVVNGRGYTQVRPRQSEPEQTRTGSNGSSAGSSGSGSNGVSSQGYSGGSSSGSTACRSRWC